MVCIDLFAIPEIHKRARVLSFHGRTLHKPSQFPKDKTVPVINGSHSLIVNYRQAANQHSLLDSSPEMDHAIVKVCTTLLKNVFCAAIRDSKLT